ncbi:hypothetical protein BV25DRAFT_1876789 [Artomyces pyxidatus]|uniref:Uncharacterized protein n=1 Tax=Artomyces pyxidatus TaxID=48021 RepID=A0ACB8THK2_9AGAM|nr:hypothetical protein BV25DRAFT_1876789 [Artomyces pyxidatus]
MRFWTYFPLSAKLNIFWERITSSRIATFYLVFSVLHCVLQVVFQVQAFSINLQAANFLYGLVEEGHATAHGFFVLKKKLHYCEQVPSTLSTNSCQIVWNGTVTNATTGTLNTAAYIGSGNSSSSASPTSSVPTSSVGSSSVASLPASVSAHPTSVAPASITAHTSAATPTSVSATVTKTVVKVIVAPSQTADAGAGDNDEHNHKKRTLFGGPKPEGNLTDVRAFTLNGQIGVTLNGFGYNNATVSLDNKCLVALNWPVQSLDNTKREDIAFVAFQVWLLGISVVALLNESIPHIVASLLTHLSATAWGGFQVYATNAFHNDFKRLTTNGACQVNLLPNYWSSRAHAEIPSVALNAAALLLSAFLSFRLIKLFGWQTFKRVGASRTINRIYKLVLTLSIIIQLSLFFVVAAVGLWIDQLYNGAIAIQAVHAKLYEILLTVVLCLLVPWLVMGWFAVRRELKAPMVVFLVLSVLYLLGFGVMFDSTTFRWTFVQWGFFSVVTTVSAILTLLAFLVGLACRMNFDKGLTRYLNAQEPLSGDDFAPLYGEKGSDEEKFDFPSNDRPIPTFSAAFGSGTEVPPPSQMFPAGARQKGPRFYNSSAQPFESSSDIAEPAAAYTGGSPTSSTGQRPLVRHGSDRSQHSFTSFASTSSDGRGRSSSGGSTATAKARWVIE